MRVINLMYIFDLQNSAGVSRNIHSTHSSILKHFPLQLLVQYYVLYRQILWHVNDE